MWTLVTFADDSALLSLLQGSECHHGPALDEFVEWCDNTYLNLNVKKTKDMIIDFRRQGRSPPKTFVHNQEVEIVSTYTYFGSIFDNKLKLDLYTEAILKKGQQRLYFLRKLRSFMVDREILSLFYKTYIESVISFSFICWLQNLS